MKYSWKLLGMLMVTCQNAMGEMQEEPFQGDAVNAYNDGPLEEGGQMGPFYELESSSPAAALKPQETMTHIHRTFHFQGSPEQLEPIARKVSGIGLQEIRALLRSQAAGLWKNR